MNEPRPWGYGADRVAVLCAGPSSIYSRMAGVDVFDKTRDVKTFTGGMPVVAHPPCRSWSAFCAHQAKPEPGEKELGLLCVEWLLKCGGILEHPAHSRLWDAAKLPKPGWTSRGDLWSVEVSQAWWGDTREKSTWLCFSKISPDLVTYPIKLHTTTGDRRRWQLMSNKQRSATCPAFAEWLVQTARLAGMKKAAELSPHGQL